MTRPSAFLLKANDEYVCNFPDVAKAQLTH